MDKNLYILHNSQTLKCTAAWDRDLLSSETGNSMQDISHVSPSRHGRITPQQHSSPTPTIIDELMGDLVFETFTPRCPLWAVIVVHIT